MSHGHSIRCHSPFKHYTMFHSSSSLGNFNNSIFGGFRCSTTYNINVNDGGFWGGFKNGLGMGFGNFLGGLFGGFMGGGLFGGMFGGGMGFGFPWGGGFGGGLFGGGYGNYGGGAGNYGDNDGAGRSGRRTRTSSDRSTNGTDGGSRTHLSADCEDKDRKYIQELRIERDNVGDDPAKAKALRDKINAAIEQQKDSHQNTYDEGDYKDILKFLENRFNFDQQGNATLKNNSSPVTTPVVTNTPSIDNNGTAATASGDANPTADGVINPDHLSYPDEKSLPSYVNVQKITLPAGYEFANSNNMSDINEIECVHDTGDTQDVKPQNNKFKISDSKTKEGFPEYFTVTDTQGTYCYKCIGVVAGKAIYSTPTTDANNNKYVLTIHNNKFVLWQDENLPGHNQPDKQLQNQEAAEQ